MSGRLSARLHGGWRVILLALAVLLLAADAAWAARPFTLAEQAHINVLRKYRPDIADKLVRRLEKLEEELEKRPDLTEEQKNEARQKVIDKQIEAADAALLTAQSLGTDQQQLDASKVYDTLRNFWYIYQMRDDPFIAPREVYVERARLQEEARKKAEEERKKAEQQEGGEQSRVQPRDSQMFFQPGNYAMGLFAHVDGPNNPFLATEFGPGTLELGAVTFEPRGTTAGFRAGGRAPLNRLFKIAESESPRPQDRIFYTYNFFQNAFDDSRSLGTFFTDGAGLGIPGTGDPNANFPAGVFLPFAGGLNTVTDMNGSFDFNTFGGGVALGVPFPVGGGVTVAPFAGVDFASINQDVRFSGAVPGFALDFLYDTNANAFQLSPNIGAEVIIPLIVNDPGGPGPNVALQVIPRVYVDTLFFGGSDSLDLSGIVNDAQKVGLDGSDTNFGFSVEGNLIIQDIFSTPIDVIVGGFVSQRQTSIVIERSGETGEESKAVASSFWAYGVNFGLELRY